MVSVSPGVDLDMDDEQSPRQKRGSKKAAKKLATSADRPVSIRPVAKKVGESDDSLQQRAEWFRRRTTDGKNHG